MNRDPVDHFLNVAICIWLMVGAIASLFYLLH